MKPGSRLGKDPLSRAGGTGTDDVLRNILEPSAAPAPVPNLADEAMSLAGERFAKALSSLMALAAQNGLLPEEGPRDRTMLLLVRLVETLRLSPTDECVDMAAYTSGVSGPWTLVCAPELSPAPLRAALGLALGLRALTDCLRTSPHKTNGPLTLRLEQAEPTSFSLRLLGPPEAFPESLGDLSGSRAADLKTLALRGLLSVRFLSCASMREVRLDAPSSL